MKRTYWYAAMSENEVQRSRWTFYEVVNLVTSRFILTICSIMLFILALEACFR